MSINFRRSPPAASIRSSKAQRNQPRHEREGNRNYDDYIYGYIQYIMRAGFG